MENKEEHDLNDAAEKVTKYQKLKIPGLITIGEYNYIYKDQSKTNPNLFFYRCQRSNCRITIEIDRNNIDKIVKKNTDGEIINKCKKDHKCENINYIKSENIDECSTEGQIKTKAYNIILLNPLKPLGFHTSKLTDMNIHLNDDKINRLIYKARNSLYPKDDDYIYNIINIKISFDDNIPESQNIPFCQSNNKFFNPYKNRIEAYILFTTKYHLKLLTKASQVFMDATFKVAPKNYYQLFNILGFLETENLIFPIAFVIMSSKSYLAYKKIFQDIKLLLNI